jgi:hypothetical protein
MHGCGHAALLQGLPRGLLRREAGEFPIRLNVYLGNGKTVREIEDWWLKQAELAASLH